MTISRMSETTPSSGQDSSSTSATNRQSDVTKDAFLQLLVAQIKNQDPLNPTDGVQFLTQLAQFTELEQLTGMRTDLQGIADTLNKNLGTTKTQ